MQAAADHNKMSLGRWIQQALDQALAPTRQEFNFATTEWRTRQDAFVREKAKELRAAGQWPTGRHRDTWKAEFETMNPAPQRPW